MNRPLIKIADIVLIAVIIACSAAAIIGFSGGKGDTIRIDYNGDTVHTLPLNKDASVTVNRVTVTIKDGRAFVSDSDCRDKTCMRTTLKKAGDVTVCLPNRVTVTVTGDSSVDAVTY